MKEAIRLTNKTAIALRKNAKSIRTAYLVAEVVVSLVLGAAGVVLGLFWLPAVPIMIAVIALIDCALMTASRSRYLSLLGQAICTEAAAREISAEKRAQSRREQAAKDLMEMKADLKAPLYETKQPGVQPFFEKKEDEEQEDEDLLPQASAPQPAAKKAEEGTQAPRRRRRENPLTLIRSEQAK